MNGAVRCETIGSAVGMAPSRSRPDRPLSISSMSLRMISASARMRWACSSASSALPRQADEAVAALDDRRAEILLELANRRRERGLRHVAGVRRAAEMLFARQRHKIFQLPQHHGAQSSRRAASAIACLYRLQRRRHGAMQSPAHWRGSVVEPSQIERQIARFAAATRPLAIAIAVIALIGLGVWIAATPSRNPTSLIGGPFALQTGDGKTLTDADMKGRPFLVYFGYIHCPDVARRRSPKSRTRCAACRTSRSACCSSPSIPSATPRR